MKTLYVTSNQPSAGKTAFCSAFGSLIQQHSKKVAVFKPVTTWNSEKRDSDTQFYDSLFKGTPTKPWPIKIDPESLSRPLDTAHQTILQNVKKEVVSLEKAGLSVIVEGLPTHDQSGNEIALTQEMAKVIGSNVISITTCTQSTEKQATALLTLFPNSVKGTIINNITRYKHHEVTKTTIPSIERAGITVLAAIPEHRYLMAKTVLEISTILQGKIVQGKEHNNRLVEHIMIGGLILGSGTEYFGKYSNKAVVVRGDRPDIQMVALSGDTSCLILTGGYLPTQYVEYEAAETDVPLVCVDSNTHTTMEALATIELTSPFADPRKVDRFQTLLREYSKPNMLTDLANLV